MGQRRRGWLWVVLLALLVVGVGAWLAGPWAVREIRARLSNATVADRVAQTQPRVGPIWEARWESQGRGKPARVCIVVLKAEREVRVYDVSEPPVMLATYSVTAASGGIGPKLREGDRQVPEGLYRVEFLNPNSRFHLSIRVDYPNDEDRTIALADGRRNLGGDIMIHGGAASVGCVAIGDDAIEEMFWLVASVGQENVEVVLSPSARPIAAITKDTPAWVGERYRAVGARLAGLGMAQTE